MKNRAVGFLIIGFAGVLGLVTYLFNKALINIVSTSCTHGDTCPMWDTIKFETNISLVIIVATIIFGIFLMFAREQKQPAAVPIRPVIIREKTRPAAKEETPKKDYGDVLKTLIDDEKQVLQKIIDAEGTIFQSDLVDKTGFNKAKITRILDRFEGKGLIERKRRGMTNVVILKR